MSLIMDPNPPFSHLPSSQQPLQPNQSYPPLTSVSRQHPTVYSAQNRGIHRRSTSRTRSTTSSNPDRLEGLLPEQIKEQLPLSPGRSVNTAWSSPRSSPRPHAFLQPQPINSHPIQSASSHWVLPTPPQLESQPPTAPTPASISQPFRPAGQQPPQRVLPNTSAPMGSVHYGMPAQYGPLGIDESTLHGQSAYHTHADPHSNHLHVPGYSFDHGFRASIPQQAAPQSYDFSQADNYGANVIRTSSPMPMAPQYNDEYRVGTSYSYTSGMTPRVLPSTSMSSQSSSYSSAYERASSQPRTLGPESDAYYSRTPSMYDHTVYSHQPMPSQPGLVGQPPQSLAYAQPMYASGSMQSLPRSMSSMSGGSGMRISNQKPKPQCWEHGCNGRRFSTFSNLLRHQREKSGTATKSYCPRCGAEFTRTTARNGHLAHDKCTKQRKSSESSR